MNYQQARDYLLSHPESREDFPFGADVAVMKINNKMFATLGQFNGEARANLKCDPDEAEMLRDIFESVLPGYHMNKRHWNTVILEGDIPRGEIERMMDRSYGLVVKGLNRIERNALILAYGQDAIFK
jgi:predicted DNA-binding protein (MmcQ/YjbR family)